MVIKAVIIWFICAKILFYIDKNQLRVLNVPTWTVILGILYRSISVNTAVTAVGLKQMAPVPSLII